MGVSAHKFEGWAGLDGKATKGGMVFQEFEPKAWDEDDLDVKIQYCGICGSDVHALSGDWGPLDAIKPEFCGHELVGEVTKVGSTVTGFQVGDHVGVGAQSDSCRTCRWCTEGLPQVCSKITWTFSSPYHNGNAGQVGSISRGGFAKYWRGPSGFAIKIPHELDLASAAPMLCGGITVYSPLEEHNAGSKAKRVGVIGIGGLGHYGVMFAKAMGARVTAISRHKGKKQDAMALGATKYIAMDEGIKGHERSLDLIICTINPDNLDVMPYMPLLDSYGTFVLVGISPNLKVECPALIAGNRKLAGSNIGSPEQIRRMFQLAIDQKLESWTQKYDMEDINQALVDFEDKGPRYRYVLVNRDHGGKM